MTAPTPGDVLMPAAPRVRPSFGIAHRIALLAWLVSLVTLIIFVVVTVPQQKHVFQRNLESKALGVVVSLRDVAAGAAVNEDFASLVTASQTLLAGDPDLAFLVINKSDGFALVTRRSGWSVEQEIDPYWQPPQRVAAGAIETVPTLGLRSYRYSHPFDYSGIEWGWIHVGLSLDGYDGSVALLYRSTALVGMTCVVLSLLGSLLYARHMVRPLVRLREVVQEIATGMLSVRADVVRHDELGDLGQSVNLMAEALQLRDRQLQGASSANQALLSAMDPNVGIPRALEIIGEASGQDRAYFFELETDPDTGDMVARQRYEWTAAGVAQQQRGPCRGRIRIGAALQPWLEALRANRPAGGVTCEMAPALRSLFEHRGVLSMMILPVRVAGTLHAFIGFDNCRTAYSWSENEIAILASLAASIGTACERHRIENEILAAKATLELRVKARTRELQDQVEAKERALSELASAQGTLVELSRSAGMAEVATGVLHNVGNVLNSVNVSCNLLIEGLRDSRVGKVSQVAELMNKPAADIGRFMSEDPRGLQIPAYLAGLASALEEERARMLAETRTLHDRIDHIKEIVAMQQTYGRVMGVLELLPPAQLMEDALKLNAEALARHAIQIRREYAEVPDIRVDKHKVLQILLNLINNAKHACAEFGRPGRIITLKMARSASGLLRLEVADNGVGIDPENLRRVFQHGFTTRRDGHGFGLHSGALVARELGGSLHAASDGVGRGATFTLELPFNTGEY